MKKLTTLLLFVMVALLSNAQISRYLKSDGTGDGTSWATAAGTADIQTMIDAVAADPNQGTVYFAAGTYLISAQIQIKNNVQMMGGYAADGSGTRDLWKNQTILDGDFKTRILFTGDQSPHVAFDKITKVDGFVLQRGSSSYGSAAAISVGTVLENCIIRNNNGSTFGSAIFIKRHATLTNPTVGWNMGAALINCVIVNNSSSGYAGAVFVNQDTHFSLNNCVIANNKSTDATNGVGGLYWGQNVRYSRVSNSIFYNNTAPTSTRNNIFFQSAGEVQLAIFNNYFSDAAFVDADITTANGNKNATDIASPGFAGATAFDGHSADNHDVIEAADWRLTSNSALRGLGSTVSGRADIPYPYVNARFNNADRSFSTVTTDVMGNPRVINSTVEPGAYEYDPITSTVSSSNNSHGTVNANQEVSKGSKITQTATPEAGYRFINWTESDTEVSTATSYTFTATANRTLQANFASNTVIITEASNTNATSLNNCEECDITVTGATLTVNNAKSVKSIVVEPGAKVVANQPLTITGEMKLKAGKSSAPGVKIDAAISVTGNLTLEKTLDNSKWYFISLPSTVSIASISKVSGSGTPVYGDNWWIKYYDGASRIENLGTVSNWKTLTSDQTLEANKGYIIGLANSLTGDYVFSFPLNNALISSAETARTVAVVNHGEALGIGENHKGWNLVGIPYLSSFSGNNVGAGYLTFHNGTTYTQSAKADVPSIDPFTSFFVQASSSGTGANLSFDLAGRQSVKAAVNNNSDNILKINLTTSGGSDHTTLILNDNQVTGYTINHDLEKWLTTGTDVPQLFSKADGIRYAFNALPVVAVNNLPLGLYSKYAGEATISMEPTSMVQLDGLILNDLQTGISTDLSVGSYTFVTASGTTDNRFTLSAKRVSTAAESNYSNGLIVYSPYNNALIVRNLQEGSIISVFDISGKLILRKSADASYFHCMIPLQGIYQVQIVSETSSSLFKIVL